MRACLFLSNDCRGDEEPLAEAGPVWVGWTCLVERKEGCLKVQEGIVIQLTFAGTLVSGSFLQLCFH